MSGIFVPRDSFAVEIDGVRYVLHKGVTRVRQGHPVMVGREDLFEPITVDLEVEAATAAPGEQRTTRRPKSKAKDTTEA